MTAIIDIMCQNIQWIVSNEARFDSLIRIRILVMFRMNSEAVAVIIALILVLGSMFGVDRIRIRRR